MKSGVNQGGRRRNRKTFANALSENQSRLRWLGDQDVLVLVKRNTFAHDENIELVLFAPLNDIPGDAVDVVTRKGTPLEAFVELIHVTAGVLCCDEAIKLRLRLPSRDCLAD